jgi:hypothetical protein
MTANELAQIIEDAYPRGFVKDAADMLRQQAHEIKELKEMTDKESAIYSTGYWNGIAYKRQRELTDEEITEVWTNIPESPDDIWAFARAILRKASEK